MSYFRTRFSSFEEFNREGIDFGGDLGKDELELLEDLEDDDSAPYRPRRRRSSWAD